MPAEAGGAPVDAGADDDVPGCAGPVVPGVDAGGVAHAAIPITDATVIARRNAARDGTVMAGSLASRATGTLNIAFNGAA
jgi:hypothetical protein